MACHDEVLDAAKIIVKLKGRNEFSPIEVIKHLIKQSTSYSINTIRTHICSRCCINAPKHHEVKWHYFKRLRRGVYSVL